MGQKIREQRNLAGMTQTELAKKLGISFQQIQKYEIGANRVSASKLFEIAKCFNATVSSFFPEGDDLVEYTSINHEEADLVTAYREAPPQIKTAVRSLLLSLARDKLTD